MVKITQDSIKIGLVGLSEGNGHPYSFGAIINGYDKEAMRESEWDVIYNYLQKCDRQDFLNRPEVKITHCYTQDVTLSKNLSKACKIPHIAHSLEELNSADIDAVIIARDDWQNHKAMAQPFLESGKYVFIDKPLSLDSTDLAYFLPFLESKKLMSCSGLRYARELDSVRKAIREDKERIIFIEGSIGSAWDRYFIHLLDGIFGLTSFKALEIHTCALEGCLSALIKTESFEIQLNNRAHFAQPCTFAITTDKNRYELSVSDNFSAFRRCLGHFVDFIQGSYDFNFHATLESMNILSEIKEQVSQISSVSYPHTFSHCDSKRSVESILKQQPCSDSLPISQAQNEKNSTLSKNLTGGGAKLNVSFSHKPNKHPHSLNDKLEPALAPADSASITRIFSNTLFASQYIQKQPRPSRLRLASISAHCSYPGALQAISSAEVA